MPDNPASKLPGFPHTLRTLRPLQFSEALSILNNPSGKYNKTVLAFYCICIDAVNAQSWNAQGKTLVKDPKTGTWIDLDKKG